MKTTIICTVGTSTLEKIKPETLYWKKGKDSSNPVKYPSNKIDKLELVSKYFTGDRLLNKPTDDTKFDVFIREISELYIKNITDKNWNDWDSEDERFKWRLCPAEVASTLRLIQKLNLTPESTNIVLTISDTGKSYVSAKIIKKIFSELGFSIIDDNMKEIKGFQMENIPRFSEVGLPNFVNTINEYMTDEDTTDEKQIFNITGGYKNFIPLVTHIASFHRKDMYYVFEEAADKKDHALVKIPKIPTLNRLFLSDQEEVIILSLIFDNFKGRSFTSIPEAIDRIDRKLTMQLSLSKKVIKEYLMFFEDFLSETNGEVKLSVIGEVYRLLFKGEQMV